MSIRLMIADDHELVRAGIRYAVLGTEIDIVAEAADGDEVVAMARESDVDVVLLDISWPAASSAPQPRGLEMLGQIKEHKPELPVVMYSIHNRDQYKRLCRELGADGYVVKGVSRKMLIDAIRAACDGKVQSRNSQEESCHKLA
jgi:DNA-binding NarL/FixJ family response regulator